MTTRRVGWVAAGALLVTASVQSLSPTSSVDAAAPVLRELGGSPLVVNLGGDPIVAANGATSYTSAAVADVTGDGNEDIVIGSLTTRAFVFDLANSRTITLDPGGADYSTGRGATQVAPAIGDIDGDGVDDVVIGNLGGRLAAYSVRGGTARELYNHFVPPAFEGAGTGLLGTPAIGYVNEDNQLDVVTSQWGQTLDVWTGPSGQHQPHLRQWVKDSIWSSPAIGDVDGDGQAEIVVGADCEGKDVQQPCYGLGHGGYVWAFNLDGSVQWSYFVKGAVVWSSPALSDLNGDGALDVVVGTGIFFDEPAADRIRAIDGRSGQLMWEAQTPGRVFGSPAVAELDGSPRVWVVSEGGELLSWNAQGQRMWSTCVASQPCSPGLGTFGGVAIADVNDDGALDAVVQAEEHLRVLDARTGAIQTSIRSRYDRPLFASYATPTVAEVDGQTLIVHVNLGDRTGGYRIDGGDDMVVSIYTTGTTLGDAPWPTFKKNMMRTSGPLPEPPPAPVGPSGRECTDVRGSRSDAAVVNLTPVLAQGAGNGVLVSSDIAQPPLASNANFAPGTVDPNVAVARIGADGEVCYVNSQHTSVHLVADHLGTIDGVAYTPAAPNGAPVRKIDTRAGQPTGMIPPSGRVCVGVAGSPGDAAVLNLTPILAEGAGHGLLVSSDVAAPPVASNANFAVGTVDPNVAIAPIGADGQVCYVNSHHTSVHLVADHLGTIDGEVYTPARPDGAPERKIDTRAGQPTGLIPPRGRVCVAVTGAPGDAAILNLTPVLAEGAGNGLLVSSDVDSPPVASNANFAPGSVDPNVAIAPIGRDGRVCYVNSHHASVHLVADHLGTLDESAYTPATQSGAPDRRIDTRRNLR